MEVLKRRVIERMDTLKSYTEKKEKSESPQLMGRNRIEFEESNIHDVIRKNEEEFFKPAKQSVITARKAIKEWDKENYDAGLKGMEEAFQQFEHVELLFNLGKMCLARGEHYIDGIIHLLTYWYRSPKYDYYAIEIDKLLSLQTKKGVTYGTVTGLETTLDFQVDKQGYVTINDEIEIFQVEIQLPFKLPISLSLQSKEQIENEDYKYLKELFLDSNEIAFEIVLEKHKFSKFFSDFYGTVIELTGDQSNVIPLVAFEELKMELFVDKLRREHYVPQLGDPPYEIEFPEEEALMSILKVKVPLKVMNEFIVLYRDFARRNLISPLNSERKLTVEEQRLEEEFFSKEERLREYNQLLANGKEYAKLKCLLDNIQAGSTEPYKFKDSTYKEYYIEYVNLFQNRYKDVEEASLLKETPPRRKEANPRNKTLEESKDEGFTSSIAIICNKIKHEVFREKLVKQLTEIEKALDTAPNFTLTPMRVALESVVKEACLKNKIPTTEMINNKKHNISLVALKNKLVKKLDSKEYLEDLKYVINMGNTGSHYDELESFISIDSKEARSIFRILLQCIEFLVVKFKL